LLDLGNCVELVGAERAHGDMAHPLACSQPSGCRAAVCNFGRLLSHACSSALAIRVRFPHFRAINRPALISAYAEVMPMPLRSQNVLMEIAPSAVSFCIFRPSVNAHRHSSARICERHHDRATEGVQISEADKSSKCRTKSQKKSTTSDKSSKCRILESGVMAKLKARRAV